MITFVVAILKLSSALNILLVKAAQNSLDENNNETTSPMKTTPISAAASAKTNLRV